MVRAARADYLSVLDKAVDTQAALDRVYARYRQTPPALAAAESGEPEGAWDEEQDEDPPEPVWDPGDEIDDQGGMSEITPMADEAARLEAEFYGFGSEAGA